MPVEINHARDTLDMVRSIAAERDRISVELTALGIKVFPSKANFVLFEVDDKVVRVSNPGLSLSVRDEENPKGRTYVHPRTRDCILGGTLDEGAWDTSVDLAAGEAGIRRPSTPGRSLRVPLAPKPGCRR